MKSYQKWSKIIKIKNINEHISAQKHHQATIIASFYIPVIQFDKFFYPVDLYEKYLICIFMNINENFCNERKNLRKNKGCTYKMTNVAPTQYPSFSSKNSLGTCVQDMKSCPTHAVESSKIRNGFDTAGSRFHTRQPSLFHTCFDRVQVWQQVWPWKTSDFQLIFVFLDDASTVRSCKVISEHHILAI